MIIILRKVQAVDIGLDLQVPAVARSSLVRLYSELPVRVAQGRLHLVTVFLVCLETSLGRDSSNPSLLVPVCSTSLTTRGRRRLLQARVRRHMFTRIQPQLGVIQAKQHTALIQSRLHIILLLIRLVPRSHTCRQQADNLLRNVLAVDREHVPFPSLAQRGLWDDLVVITPRMHRNQSTPSREGLRGCRRARVPNMSITSSIERRSS